MTVITFNKLNRKYKDSLLTLIKIMIITKSSKISELIKNELSYSMYKNIDI